MSVFERFTRDAREIVVDAQRVARDSRWQEVRNEHLMLVLVRQPESAGVRVLAAAGVTDADRGELEAELAALNRRAGVSDADAEALREIGIEVEQVLDRLEELAGAPWPDEAGGSERGLRRHLGFSRPAKYTLERALREAIHLRHKHIDSGHIMLGLLSRPGVVSEVLEKHGVTYADVRRAMAERSTAG